MNDIDTIGQMWANTLNQAYTKYDRNVYFSSFILKHRRQCGTLINDVLCQVVSNPIERYRLEALSILFGKPIQSLAQLTYPDVKAFIQFFNTPERIEWYGRYYLIRTAKTSEALENSAEPGNL